MVAKLWAGWNDNPRIAPFIISRTIFVYHQSFGFCYKSYPSILLNRNVQIRFYVL